MPSLSFFITKRKEKKVWLSARAHKTAKSVLPHVTVNARNIWSTKRKKWHLTELTKKLLFYGIIFVPRKKNRWFGSTQESKKRKEKIMENIISALENNPDIVAWKVWTKDDIKECLEEDGFLPSDENVDLVMQAVREGLSDCNDYDWSVIHDAIYGMTEDLI